MKRLSSAMLLVSIIAVTCFAQEPSGYYDSAKGKSKKDLLSALNSIVGEHKTVSYSGLWDVYKESDVRPDGYIWDMYSTSSFKPGKDQCGTYSSVGDCYNREHSFPKSWFDDASPMVSDAYHIYPTDGKVNGQRSNHPYGECANGTTLSGSGSVKALGKLGSCTFPGYSGTVFEPDDQYKGDFARSYFYMAATYMSRISSWNSAMLSGDNYPCFKSWAINLLLKWHRQDPVSQKEIDRNNVVYTYQKNRNPFIDHPELAEYIWGNLQNSGWVPGGVADPMIVAPEDGYALNMGVTAVGRTISQSVKVLASDLSEDLKVSISGSSAFSLGATTISAANANNGTYLPINFVSASALAATATVTLSSSEVNRSFVVSAQAIDGIPALPATNVSTFGFTANWTDVDEEGNYLLSVFDDDGATLVSGYPVNVTTADECYDVTDLNANSTYFYQLAKDTRKSNVVKVTTLDYNRILAIILPDGGFKFSALTGDASEPIEGGVYTEYIDDDITATVTGNFEISLDKQSWAKSVTIDKDGESFYIRSAATNEEGIYDGMLSLSTPTVDGEEAELLATVAAPREFFEDFETMDVSSYATQKGVQGSACKWDLVDMGVYGSTGDHYNDKAAARFGKTSASSLTMAEDVLSGIGTLSFLASQYSNDGEAEIDVDYSTDGGQTWINADHLTITEKLLKQYSYKLNIVGAARVRFVQTSGKRINIDDVAISGYTSFVTSVASDRKWDAYGEKGGAILEGHSDEVLTIYSVDAVTMFEGVVSGSQFVALPAGIYVVATDTHSKKIVVK